MAIVHKVIVLNTPFKLFGFSFIQWLVLLVTGLIGLWIGFSMPTVKFNGLPLGFLVFMAILCGGMVFVHASLIQPWQWWRNRFLHIAKLLPTEILPKPQPIKTYFEDKLKEANKLPNSSFKTNLPLKKDKWQL
jgi:hypothetical protein